MNQEARPKHPRPWRTAVSLLLLAVLAASVLAWFTLFREEPERAFASDTERFLYGSLSAEYGSGIPYWIFQVLPRMFPEHVPGPGGLRAFGFAWEEGQELPVGFTKRVIGFPRVSNNCAVCHAASYRTSPEENPKVAAGGGSHTANVQAFIRFLTACAEDERFTSGAVLREIASLYRLSLVEKIVYRFLIIPRTRRELLNRRDQFAWMNRPGWPHWGPGRDDPMNLTKYFMTRLPVDNTVGTADFPALWFLRPGCERAPCSPAGQALNWDGATPSARSVIIDSALGLGARPDAAFLGRMEWLQRYLSGLPPPAYPFGTDGPKAERGAQVFAQHCAPCHGREGARTGTIVPADEVGTDRERLDTWTQEAADVANRTVADMGIDRIGLWKTGGYVAVPLQGIWLRAPYLHNGSVPTLRDLLEPAEKRPRTFHRGYDVLDPVGVGFVSQGPAAERAGFALDTRERGNGNGGHLYGTALPAAEKDALVEYLKTL